MNKTIIKNKIKQNKKGKIILFFFISYAKTNDSYYLFNINYIIIV